MSMNNKVYYGEYTLLHWIELILRKNVVLPSYQRHFVWEASQVYKFISSIKKGNFVPPVTIGSFKGENIILDGQQRLSSILLSYIGYFPKKDAFRETDLPGYVDSDDDVDTGEEDEVIKWTFRVITDNSKNKSIADILVNIDLTKYDKIEEKYCIDDKLINSTYLGFSYIVPEGATEVEQQKFYSTVFRDINQQGVALFGPESRRALYYLDSELEPFFNPKVCDEMKLLQSSKVVKYDFVRALAFLSQYYKNNGESGIAKKCRRHEQFEAYYENYINDVVLDVDSDIFGKFSIIMGKTNIESRTSLLKSAFDAMSLKTVFPTIIEADTHLFGLIYHVYLVGKTLKTDDLESLKRELADRVTDLKAEDGHTHSPNKVTFIRRRIKVSIDVYSRFTT